MNKIREKIEARLDALEHALLRQDHLVEDPVAVLQILASVSKFYSALQKNSGTSSKQHDGRFQRKRSGELKQFEEG